MVIQHITIQNFGSVLSYEAAFTPEITVIDSRHTAEIAAAIGLLLCSKAPSAILEHWVEECTNIAAEIRLSDAVYTVCAKPQSGRLQLSAVDPTGEDATARYQYALSHCWEQDDVEAFDGQDSTIPLRLFRYRSREDRDDLSCRTQRLADTKIFRRYLFQYIRAFQPEPINCKKNYQTTIDSQGKFIVFYPGVAGDVFLSETEEKLFLYICFLNVAEFWAGFERIRDLHHEKKPLLIRDFIEFLDESANINALIARTQKLQRQIIILASPLAEETKKKWIGEVRGVFF